MSRKNRWIHEWNPFPSSPRRGGCGVNKTFPFQSAAAGVVCKKIVSMIDHHPVCAAPVASRHLISSASTPPRRGGKIGPILNLLLLLVFSLAAPCAAQDMPAWEFFAGYSFQRSDVRQYFRSTPIQFTFRGEYMNFNGWNLSVTENRNRWFGGTLDVRGHIKTTESRGTTNRAQTYSFLYGPRFSYRMSWLNPFTHILMGAARTKVNVTRTGQPRASGTSFAIAAGLGLDVKFASKVSARIQADYFRTDVLGTRPDSFRTSAGVVFHLGKRE